MLERGITGFDPSVKGVDPKSFSEACYAVARTCSGRVSELDSDVVTKNFFVARIDGPTQGVFVLCNSSFPIVAFAEQIDPRPFVLVDAPAEEFTIRNFSILHARKAKRPVEARDLERLSHHELKQVEYWRPKTLADLVFNTWD